MAVVLILGVLLAIALPSFRGFTSRAVDSAAPSSIRSAVPSVEAYYADNGTYAGISLAVLQGGASLVLAPEPPAFGMDNALGREIRDARGAVPDERTSDRLTRERVAPLRVSDVMVSRPKTVPADATVAELRALFGNSHVVNALLVRGTEFAGSLDRDDLPVAAADDELATDYATLEVPAATPGEPMVAVLERLDALDIRRLVVLDQDGTTLRGLLCLGRDRSGFCTD